VPRLTPLYSVPILRWPGARGGSFSLRSSELAGPVTQNASVSSGDMVVDKENRALLFSAAAAIAVTSLLAVTATAWAGSYLALSPWVSARLLCFAGLGAGLIIHGLPAHSPHLSFGAANQTTVARGALVAFLAVLLFERTDTRAQLVALIVACLAATLDAVDGWLARRTRMSSEFGARFDMETDALFILVLSLWAWRLGKAGPWVVAGGVLRYGFVAAAVFLPAMQGELPASFRRKAIAAMQMVALLVVIAPFVPPHVSAPIAAASLLALTLSFLIDTLWLLRR
jgi:phosphatidylglycerophosphate synthase